MACKVKVNRHGYLAFRLYWDGNESWEGTDWKDTPKNRTRAEARAVLISEHIDSGTFDYLKWFPAGNKSKDFKPKEIANQPNTVEEYFRVWIESKKPPAVRKGLERDYREHFRRYVLPHFANVNLKDVSPRKLLDFRTCLTGHRGIKDEVGTDDHRRIFPRHDARCAED